MSVSQFIPTVWSARILEKLQSALVYAQSGVVTNAEFQGELSDGDKLHVHGFSDVDVAPYERNSTTITYQKLDDERRTLEITESNYFAVSLDDLDRVQMRPKIMDAVAQDAAYQLAKKVDDFVASKYVDAGQTLDDGAGGPLEVSAANAYETFVKANVMLDENDVPEQGRFCVVPPWLAAELLLDDKYFLQASTESVLNGQVGRIANLAVLKSNRVPETTGTYNVMVGHSMAIAFAQQLALVEALRGEGDFSDRLRGLDLYGAKVMYPEALLSLEATRPTT